MTTDQPTRLSSDSASTRTHGAATFRNLALTGVAGAALMVLQSLAYHHYKPSDGSVAQDVPVYLVSAVIGCLIAGIGLFRVRRSRRPASTPRVGIVLSVLGLVLFPVAYFTPLTFIWGVTSYLLSRDAQAGPLRTAARVLGVVALCLTPVVVLLRVAGVTYQVGG